MGNFFSSEAEASSTQPAQSSIRRNTSSSRKKTNASSSRAKSPVVVAKKTAGTKKAPRVVKKAQTSTKAKATTTGTKKSAAGRKKASTPAKPRAKPSSTPLVGRTSPKRSAKATTSYAEKDILKIEESEIELAGRKAPSPTRRGGVKPKAKATAGRKRSAAGRTTATKRAPKRVKKD